MANKSVRRIQQRNSISRTATTSIKRMRKGGNGSKSKQYEQAEKALRESEEKYRNLFEYAKDAIILADTETGEILDTNTAGCNLLGLPKEKIIGMHQSELHPPELSEKYKQIFQDHIQKGVVIDEDIIVQRADGTQVPIDISASVLKLGDKTIIQGIFRDVSERLKMARALRESEERISKAFRALPEAVSIATLKDGVFIEVNDSFISLNGYTRKELIGHNAKELDMWVNPGDRYRMKQLMGKQGRFENEEFLIRRKSGEIRTIVLSADIINFGGQSCILTIGNDITERKKTEEALRQSEEKYSSLVERSNDGIIIIENGILKFINNKMAEITGFTIEEAVGQKFIDFAPPEEKRRLMEMHMKRMSGEDVPTDYEATIVAHDGHHILTEVNACRITYEGRPAVMAIIRDITERKQAEQALRESEEKFSKAFHAMPEAVCISRIKDGVFIDVNESFCRENGYTREEVIGHDETDLNLSVEPNQREQIVKKVKKQGRAEIMEFDFRKKSGEIHTVLFSADIVNIGGEPCLLSITSDITERKRMEQALRESEEKISKAFRAIPEAVSIASLEDDVFLEVNDSFISFSDYSRDEIIGHTTKEIVHWVNPDDQNRMKQLRDKHTHFKNEEFLLQRKSGETLTLLMSGDVINFGGKPCMLVVGNDITERKQMEQALRESEEKFSKAFHAIPDAVSIATLKDGVFIDVNESFCRNNEYTREEVIGHPGKELITWVNPSQRDKFFKLVREKGHVENKECEFRKKSSEIHTALMSADTINIGGQTCVLSITSDITERKIAEKNLQKALLDLEQSSALLKAANKELESFSYSVSHDLRSPLRSIDGFSQALLEDYSTKLDEKGNDYLTRLRNASQKMGELIDGLLKLSRLTRSEMHHEKVDLTSLANEIATRLQETHEKRDVKFIIGQGLTANGDPQMLRVLLENLLGNAWKFTKKTPKTRIEFGSTIDGERKTFFIKDNGAGFDIAFKDKLFTAFQRLHDAAEYPGTGIGLATVQRIINRHGGSIRADGAIGKGATFYFTLN